ncbi:MAG: hypothetical protein H0U51_05185 [Propionibacteriales bacterium]|nr:hypothetical protein [Propionibacteriales bacterium]
MPPTLSPATRALTPARLRIETLIHKDLDEGIEFPEQGFAVRPSGASTTDKPMRVGDKVLFANLVEDTDLFVVPLPVRDRPVRSAGSRRRLAPTTRSPTQPRRRANATNDRVVARCRFHVAGAHVPHASVSAASIAAASTKPNKRPCSCV